MSRIGKLPIAIPNGVNVTVSPENIVTVKGPKGELTKKMHEDIKINVENNEVIVERQNDDKKNRALHGLTRSLVNNMVVGVSEGFTKTLELVGVGYRAQLKGKTLVLNLGYSHPIEIQTIDGVQFEVPEATKIIVKGIDKETVGQIAAVIRSKRKPEPYKGKGVKYQGEYIRRKEGKTGK